ncbi:phage portal protein (plasmid) [Streptomyces graminifolii]|uniref:phage portal protein n=1 Tax=Streptomyces graminifolii TaxID=1266771 RepID=UPI00405892A1
MSLLDRFGKAFGFGKPADVQVAEEAAGMSQTRPFSPGEPLAPYDGYSRTPRSQDYPTGHNISARPKSNERVSFDTLRGLIDSYDIAQMCIWHRIDSIRALDWSLVPARGFRGDADAAIDLGMKVLAKPDGQHPFPTWLASWLYDILAFDAGALYRRRNRAGRPIGLTVVDGTTIAPLLDYWGRSPEDPATAYVQFAQGLPWNDLTRRDMVYVPFRPRSNSPYGYAPLESILLNANTDLRFQAYFLQRFTEGNIPAAFASAPESWTPQQIEEFQGYWDAFLMGDQAIKSQIRWMPGGGKIEWSNEKEFSDGFSLFLMRKTCAAYHVVPADLGFTENVNRSSGESQGDVQHRVGDLPLVSHIEGILSDFLQSDMGLPVEFAFDTGQEKEDRLALAQAWQIYIDSGMASSDEGREELIGLPSDPRRPTPRFINTSQNGPVPLLSLDGLGGVVDPETFAPSEDQVIPAAPAVPAAGVIPAAGSTDAASVDTAEDAYQAAVREAAAPSAAISKDDAPAAPAPGITADTGIYGHDLDKPDDEDAAALTKREMAAFRTFRKARRRTGAWRDFEFRHVDTVVGRRLNQGGRAQVRKDAGEVACAGLVVQAADTGRVLMIQRALDPDDPAGGTWEFPGGHLEGDEQPVAAAAREWSEETHLLLPFDPEGIAALAFSNPAWVSGIYAGYLYTIPTESMIALGSRSEVNNPDDPDGDCVEAVAWWDPEQLRDNPVVRPELLDSLNLVLRALGNGDETVCPCGMPCRFDDIDGWMHTDGSHGHDDGESVSEKLGISKAAHPKGDGAGEGSDRWPGWKMDLKAIAHWVPRIIDALRGAVNARSLVDAWLALNPTSDKSRRADRLADLNGQAQKWLEKNAPDLAAALESTLHGVYTDGYLIGALSAEAAITAGGVAIDWGNWTPGDTKAAQLLLGPRGDGAGLEILLRDSGVTIRSIAANRVKALGMMLADGALRGDSPERIASDIEGLLSNVSRAEMIATTELARAVSQASLRSYIANDIEFMEWVSAGDGRVCNLCADNVEGGPRRPGTFFPNGQTSPPGHPWCRCALVPVIGGM